MRRGFEITEEDVCNVLRNCGIDVEVSTKAFNSITKEELARIEKAALYGMEIEEQTDYALQELESILREKGHLNPGIPAPEPIKVSLYERP